MPKQKEHMNLATEIIRDLLEKLAIYRTALCISLIANAILAAVLMFK